MPIGRWRWPPSCATGPRIPVVPLDGAVVDRASDLAARLRLRGADAVYAAVAQQYGTVLITLDRQQLERLLAGVPIARPADVPGELEKDG